MSSQLRTLFAATALVSALFADAALAMPVVTGTSPAISNPGDTVTVSMTVTDDGLSGFNMASIHAWDFRLRWDQAALGNMVSNNIRVKGASGDFYNGNLAGLAATLNALDWDGWFDSMLVGPDNGVFNAGQDGADQGTYYLGWMNSALASQGLNMANGFEFTAQFEIQPGADGAPGSPDHEYLISFDSVGGLSSYLGDDSFSNRIDYSGLTYPLGDRLLVTVNGQAPLPTPAPEPGMLFLLAGGLGALALSRRRR